MIDLSRLVGRLNNTKLQKNDISLFNVIRDLIRGTIDNVNDVAGGLAVITEKISGGGGGSSTGITNATYITSSSETFQLPFSRVLTAGTGIIVDNSIAGITKITSSGTGGLDYVVASDGATPVPNPLNDGFGQFIYIPYTP